MHVHHEDAGPLDLGPTAVAVGVFDGVHRGHVRVLDELRAVAAAEGATAVVVVADRHPRTVVDPDSIPRLLTDLPHRIELLAACGIEHVHVLRLDERRSLQPAEGFVREVLVDRLGAVALVGGEDLHPGHRRRGDAQHLEAQAEALGLQVVTVPLQRDDATGEPISSTLVRAALAEGRVEDAAALLGRPHEVRGVVEPGDARGRTIGFPTANVAVPGAVALPADGVYGGWFTAGDGVERAAAINIGRRPTFYDESGLRLVEAHVLDFEGDLYGQAAAVRVVARIRDEVRFDGVDALVDQLRRDVAQVRQVLLGSATGTS